LKRSIVACKVIAGNERGVLTFGGRPDSFAGQKPARAGVTPSVPPPWARRIRSESCVDPFVSALYDREWGARSNQKGQTAAFRDDCASHHYDGQKFSYIHFFSPFLIGKLIQLAFAYSWHKYLFMPQKIRKLITNN
jgi:hypothetical protein